MAPSPRTPAARTKPGLMKRPAKADSGVPKQAASGVLKRPASKPPAVASRASPPLSRRPAATRRGAAAPRGSVGRPAGEVEEDVAPGHPAHKALQWDGLDERFCFSTKRDGKRISIQTTVFGCGTKKNAARIGRLCYAKLLEGATREEVLKLRDELCPPKKTKKRKGLGQDDGDDGYAAKKKRAKTNQEAKAGEAKEDEEDQSALCTVMETVPLRAVPSPAEARFLVDGIQLCENVIMPYVGFGTYKLKKGDAFAPVLQAFRVGYRLVDTAQIYENEGDVGQALKRSGIPRDRVFLETKVWRSSHGYERTLEAARKSLRRLCTDYMDLYIIHWPGCKTGWPLPRGQKSPPDWTPEMRDTGTWRAMEQLVDEGKVRAIGVSNYSVRHLQLLLKGCRIRPVVNQVEFHPWLVQSELLEFCKKEGIVLQAYASLGSGDVSCRADFFALPPVRAAAKTHDRTSAQVLLRWAMEKGIAVIPKSKSTERMVENFGVFDFSLSKEEIEAIDACHKGKRFAWKHLDPDTIP